MSKRGDHIPAIVLAATHSGAGKTTVAASVIRGLRASGLRIQPFKLGPDFIDTAYLSEAAGRNAVPPRSPSCSAFRSCSSSTYGE